MPIVPIIVALLIVGFLIWVIQTVPIPIPQWVKQIIIGVIVLGLIIWLLQLFGLDTGLHWRVR